MNQTFSFIYYTKIAPDSCKVAKFKNFYSFLYIGNLSGVTSVIDLNLTPFLLSPTNPFHLHQNTLIYCLNVLKIKEDSEVYRNAAKLVENIAIESNEWTS